MLDTSIKLEGIHMAKPEGGPPGQQKTHTVTHPTDPSSPKEVTQAQWKQDKMGQAGWVKTDTDPDAEEETEPTTPPTT
jgi:hypothetical protein